MLSKREATSGTPLARRTDSNCSSSSSVIGGDLTKGVGGTLGGLVDARQLGVGVGGMARQRLLRVGRAVAALEPLGLLGEARLALGLLARR